MTNQNLLLTATSAVLLYYFFYSHKETDNKKTPTPTQNIELENTLDKLIADIQQLNNQIN